MRVDAFAPSGDWSEITRSAQLAEQAGLDGYATPEITNDPFVTLTVAALATQRIELRTAIAVAFPRSPMVVANASWELNTNSGGRFALGLGTQVKGHNERRFSVPWFAPASRLREYVASLRAIWQCWETGGPLDYQGEHYQFTLMTPEFRHAPSGLPPIPIYTAAVRPAMLSLAGEIADGVRLHGFCTRRYLTEVTLPRLEAGLARSGRSRESFEVCGGGFIATGPDQASVDRMLEWIRYRVAFYGSTRTYGPVLSAHGWDDLNAKLHRLSKEGRWDEMRAQITDDVLHEFAAAATYDDLPAEIERRFGGLSDRVEIAFQRGVAPELMRDLLQDVGRIPTRFEGRYPDPSPQQRA